MTKCKIGGVEGGDGAGLDRDGGVGLLELGLALGELGAELGKGIYGNVCRFLKKVENSL